jgi:hypothetical protein
MNTPDPLETALAASKPITTGSNTRRITVDDHRRWQTTGQPPHEDDADIADLLDEIREIQSNREDMP